MTEKQKVKKIRAKHLLNFRRYLSLDSGAGSLFDYLDMNAFELRPYIESLWQPGMTWENYKSVWVVDHIVPLRYFDPSNEREMKLCWCHHNLRPSFYWDNHAKGYCIEVTISELANMPYVPYVSALISHIEKNIGMFEKYY